MSSSEGTSANLRKVIDRVARWMPTYTQLLLGIIVMMFGLMAYTGGEVLIHLSGNENPTNVFTIPQMDSPLPQLILLFGAWVALVPSRANRWLFGRVKKMIKGEIEAEGKNGN